MDFYKFLHIFYIWVYVHCICTMLSCTLWLLAHLLFCFAFALTKVETRDKPESKFLFGRTNWPIKMILILNQVKMK